MVDAMPLLALYSPATAVEAAETVNAPCAAPAGKQRAKTAVCAMAEQPVPVDALRDYAGRAWCGDCNRFVAVNGSGVYRRHRLPEAPPMPFPDAQTGATAFAAAEMTPTASSTASARSGPLPLCVSSGEGVPPDVGGGD